MKQAHVTLDDVQDIAFDELQIVDAPKYEERELGKPKVLMQGKHLRLSSMPWPLAPDRGFVLVQDGPSYESSVLEAKLLNLHTGEVLASLRTLYRPEYRVPGVAFGEADVDGKPWEVLVHASDGQIVPLWPVARDRKRFVEIHAGTGDAWVFEQQAAKDGEEDPYPPYRYAYWGDLRKAPPEPKEAFARRLEWNAHTPGGWLGPSWQDPAKAPLFLRVDDFGDDADECAKVELTPDGYHCVPFATWAMADGWRGEVRDDQPPVMSNAAKGEAQVLDLGERCVIEEVTLDPPRAMLRCKGFDGWYLWSPEKVVRVPRDLLLGVRSESRNGHVLELSLEQRPGEIEEKWIDMVSLRAIRARGASNLVPLSADREMLLSVRGQTTELHVLDVSTGQSHPIPFAGSSCVSVGVLAADLPLAIGECSNETTTGTALVDIEKHAIWQMPTVREAWVNPSGQSLIALVREREKTSIVQWSLD